MGSDPLLRTCSCDVPPLGNEEDRGNEACGCDVDAWRECAADHDSSIIKMCEEVTGIEVQNGSGTSWRDVPYLSGEKLGPMTEEQWLYLRQQQIKWVRPSIMACILIGLHRKYGYGYDRCLRVYQQIQAIEDEYKGNQKKICKAALEEVGVDIDDMMHRRRGKEDEMADNG